MLRMTEGNTLKRRTLAALMVGFVACAVAIVGFTASANGGPDSYSIVGAWEGEAIGAKYADHLFEFNSDGTMLSTNPTDVQLDPTAANGGTNDSVGMGAWRDIGYNQFSYRFIERNANAADHTPAGDLVVTGVITVRGNSFRGTAAATVDGQTHQATLTGVRISP